MANDEMVQMLRRITELETRITTLEDQSQRDRQLLVGLQRRLDELDKRLTQMELEPPTAEPLE